MALIWETRNIEKSAARRQKKKAVVQQRTSLAPILKAISFDPCGNTYVKMGEVVGKAFQDGGKLK